MNAIPWVMTQLLADEHRHELEAPANLRRLAHPGGTRTGRHLFHRRSA